MSDGVVVRCCETCDGPGWDALRAALDLASFDVPVAFAAQSCMNGCARPSTLALQGAGRATYFFDGVEPETDIEDILSTVRTYIAAPSGWIEDARACGRLRFCLRGRVPALQD